MSMLEGREENIHENSIKALEITHQLQDISNIESPEQEELVDDMLEQLDTQIQKLNELNETLKSNLQKYIHEQNEEIKKVTSIVKELKQKRNKVQFNQINREKKSTPPPPPVSKKVSTTRKPGIPPNSPIKKQKKLTLNNSSGNLFKDPFVPILKNKKMESRTPQKNASRPNSFLTHSMSEKQHTLPFNSRNMKTQMKSARKNTIDDYHDTDKKPLSSTAKGYKTQGKIEEQIEKIKMIKQFVSKLQEEYKSESSKAFDQIQIAKEQIIIPELSSLSELRSLNHPPGIILQVMNIICMILGQKTDWFESKKLLKQPQSLKEKLMNYDYELISPSLFSKIDKATQEISFSMPAMKSQSSAIVPLFIWINSFINYYRVAKNVINKRQEVQSVELDVLEAEKELQRLQKKFIRVTRRTPSKKGARFGSESGSSISPNPTRFQAANSDDETRPLQINESHTQLEVIRDLDSPYLSPAGNSSPAPFLDNQAKIVHHKANVRRLHNMIQDLRSEMEDEQLAVRDETAQIITGFNQITRADLVELKSLKAPPEVVINVLGAFFQVFGTDGTWKSTQREINNTQEVIGKVMSLDKDNLSPDVVTKLGKYNLDEWITVDFVKHKSKALESVYTWLITLVKYTELQKGVRAVRNKINHILGLIAKEVRILSKLERKQRKSNAVSNTALAAPSKAHKSYLDYLEESEVGPEATLNREMLTIELFSQNGREMPGDPEQHQDITVNPSIPDINPNFQQFHENEEQYSDFEEEAYRDTMSQQVRDRVYQISQIYENIDEECKDIVVESDKAIELRHEIVELEQEKADIEDQLVPNQQKASKAIDGINQSSIADLIEEDPTPDTQNILEAVMILLGKETNWENILTVISQESFSQDLRNFDFNSITAKTYNMLPQKVVKQQQSNSFDQVLDICKKLASWTTSVLEYYKYKITVEHLNSLIIEKQQQLSSEQDLRGYLNDTFQNQLQNTQDIDTINELQSFRDELTANYFANIKARQEWLGNAQYRLNELSNESSDAICSPSAPDVVQNTIVTLFLMLDERTTWNKAQASLNDPQFNEACIRLGVDQLSEYKYEHLKLLLDNQDYEIPHIRQQSTVTYYFAKWLHALKTGYEIKRAMRILTREVRQIMNKVQTLEKVEEETGELNDYEEESDPAAQEAVRRVIDLESELLSHQRFSENESRKLVEYQEQAIQALNKLTKKDLGEVRNYREPHKDVVATLAAVMIVLKKDRKWETAVKQMQNPDKFIEQLKTYSTESLTRKVNNQLNEYARLDSSQVYMKSQGASYMCEWVHAVREAYETKKRLEQLNTKVANTEELLEKARSEARSMSPKFAARGEQQNQLENQIEDQAVEEEQTQTTGEQPNLNNDINDDQVGRAQDTAEDWNAYANAPMNSPEVNDLIEEKVHQTVTNDVEEAAATDFVEKLSKSQKKKTNKNTKQAKIDQLKTDIMQLVFYTNTEMQKANKVMDEAYMNLSQVTKADLSEIKALGQPPVQLRQVLSAIMVLLGKKTKWDEIKKEIGKADFLTRLNELKRDEVTEATQTKLHNYLTQEGFKNDNMAAVSQVGERMKQFVLAIVQYHKVVTVVNNKRGMKEATEKHLAEAQEDIQEGHEQDAEKEANMSQDVPVDQFDSSLAEQADKLLNQSS